MNKVERSFANKCNGVRRSLNLSVCIYFVCIVYTVHCVLCVCSPKSVIKTVSDFYETLSLKMHQVHCFGFVQQKVFIKEGKLLSLIFLQLNETFK